MHQTVERQHNTWFRDQIEAGRQQLERGDVLPHDMVESSDTAWRDDMNRKVAIELDERMSYSRETI
ncbi:toxin-antitoxin system protein [Escherichia coli]|nr:toxin-antitoxin system protein [Escherichia coli]EEX5925963.1 toxin-antitoxin system protein [Escherichia coli]EGK3843811.1 toxin-antitoxin system protein [Escherichia coli]EHK6131284.1 toxin-antitoxin system protein [Escherichia coli]EHM4467061.1 toxin-antitoxin system protein [Escherichia coli]